MAINDVAPEQLIKRVAEELKKETLIQPPEWATFVKTGVHKERQPTQDDWWYVRAASVLRKIFALGPIGVSKLRTIYGGKKNRGARPERFYPASGNILRKILQQLEKAGLAKQTEKGVHKGRIVTPKGHAMLEAAASILLKEAGIEIHEKPKGELKPKKAPAKKKAAKKTVKKAAKKETEETKKAPKAKEEAPAKETTEKKTEIKKEPAEAEKTESPQEENNGEQ